MSNFLSDRSIILIFVAIAIVLLFILMISIIIRIEEFQNKLKYIKLEINRTRGVERKYWIRRKRRLWLSLFLFFNE